MRLIVALACILLAATAVVAQEDPCAAELARCREVCSLGNREVLVNECVHEAGFLSKACSCGGALDAPAGEEGAIETTSETVYFDGGAMAMLGSEDTQEAQVRNRPEPSFHGESRPPFNTHPILFFPYSLENRRLTAPPSLHPEQAKKPCPHHESMSMEPAVMFGRRFGPGFGSLFDELFDEAEGPGAVVDRPMMLGGAPRVSFGPGLGVFGNARQQVMFNVAPTLVFRSMFVPQPRVRAFAIIPALDDDADLNSNDLGSMDPSARTESVMSALQRWRDASDDSAAWTAEGEYGAADGEYGAAEGATTTMELNRAAAARAKMGRGGHPRPEPEDEGGAARRLMYALASVALIASVLTLTAAALMSVASLATSAVQRIQLAWRRDRGLSVDAVDVSEPLMLEYETHRAAPELSTMYADGAPAGPSPRMSTDGGTMEVMMPMPLERGERSGWRSEPGYARL